VAIEASGTMYRHGEKQKLEEKRHLEGTSAILGCMYSRHGQILGESPKKEIQDCAQPRKRAPNLGYFHSPLEVSPSLFRFEKDHSMRQLQSEVPRMEGLETLYDCSFPGHAILSHDEHHGVLFLESIA